jgi:hypothetical protein
MTKNNINQKEIAFEKGLQGLRKVSLAPEEKGAVFKSLLKYAESHQPATMSRWAAFVNFMKGLVVIREK